MAVWINAATVALLLLIATRWREKFAKSGVPKGGCREAQVSAMGFFILPKPFR